MAPEKAPAFQFYPKDWDTDLNVVPMTYEEEGVYFALCRMIWMHKRIPSDLDQLRLFLKGQPSLKQLQIWWKKIGVCFIDRNGFLSQKRLERERRKQADRRKTQRRNGLKGGRPKAMGLPDSAAPETHDKALHLHLPTAVVKNPLPPKGGSRKRHRGLREVPQAKPEAVQQAIETRQRRDALSAQGLSPEAIEAQLEHEYEARRRA